MRSAIQKGYHGDIKFHMTLNFRFNEVMMAGSSLEGISYDDCSKHLREEGELGVRTMQMWIIIVEPRCFYVKLKQPLNHD